MESRGWKFHCEVLGVEEQATSREIKDAFRRLALRFHPDRNGGTAEANERFQSINDSYRYLMRNLASRPPPTSAIYAEPAARPSQNRSKDFQAPPPPSSEEIFSPLGRLRSFRSTAQEGYEFLHSPKMRTPLIAACCILVALLSMKMLLRGARPSTGGWPTQHLTQPRQSSPAPSAPLTDRQPAGLATATCSHLALGQGSLVKFWKGQKSEADCRASCEQWVQENLALDNSCLWNGTEFHQHAAEIPPPVGLASEPPARDHFVIVYDQTPEFEGNPPTQVRHVKLTDTEILDFNFTGSIWIEDRKLLKAREGLKERQVILTPIRHGVTGVVVMDQNDQPVQKIIYEIQ